MKNKFFLFFSIFFISLIFLYPLLFNKFYSFRDTFLYIIPLKFFLIEKLKDGQVAWYNPYNGGGEYFLLNPQINLFYPLTYLFFLPPHIAFQLFQLFQILICFIGIFLLSKSYGLNEKESIFSAFSVIFSGLFLSLWDLSFEMGCLSFSFLTLWSLKEKRYNFFLLFFSLIFFSGEPFTFFLFLLFLIFFVFIEKISFKKILKPFAILIVFFSGILFSIISILPYTTRTEKSSLVFEGINYKKILSLSSGTASFYNTNEYSYIPVLFFGTYIFFNFLQSLFSKGRNKYYLIPFFFFLILSMGTNGMFSFLYKIPPFSFLRYPERFLPLTLIPMVIESFEKKEKKLLPFLLHFSLIIISYILFFPKSFIFLLPLISLILLFLIPKDSKLLFFPIFFDLVLSLPLFTIQEFKIPKIQFDIKNPALKRIFIPEKNIIYLKYLYPNNYFTKESDLKGINSLESYTNLFYPISTNFTPSPLPLKIYNESLKDKEFFLSCEYFGIIEKEELKWLKIKSIPIIEEEFSNFKILSDGFKFDLVLKKEKDITLRFLNLPFTKVKANGNIIKVDKKDKFIKFKLKEGNYNIKVSFTPIILKIIYFISLLLWFFFLCYLIIIWIMQLF